MTLVDRMSDSLHESLRNHGIVRREIREALLRAFKEVGREPSEAMVDAFAEAGADAREAARENNRRLNRPHPNALAEVEWVPQAWIAAIDAAIAEAE